MQRLFWASLIAQLVKNLPAMQETLVWSLGWEDTRWRRYKLPTPVFLGFPCDLAGKESAHNAGDLGLIPRLGRSPGEGKGYPIQYSGLENSMDCPWGHKEPDTTERFSLHFQNINMDSHWKCKSLLPLFPVRDQAYFSWGMHVCIFRNYTLFTHSCRSSKLLHCFQHVIHVFSYYMLTYSKAKRK